MENNMNNPNEYIVTPDAEAKVDTNFTVDPTLQTSVAPKAPKSDHGRKVLLVTISLLALVMIIAISGFFLLLSGGADNPLLAALGINNFGVSSIIFGVTALITGVLGLAGLIVSLIGVFKTMNTNKTEKALKKKYGLMVIAGVVMVFVGFAGLFLSINKISNLGPVAKTEVIATNPAVTTGLTAPVQIIFEAANLPINTEQFRIVSYNWSFGDGEVANGPTVTHTYQSKPASGIYTVTLKVNYQDALDPTAEILEQLFTRVIAIENEQVFASFKHTPETGQAPLEVDFDASASKDPDGQIVTYEWDFNEDGIYDAEGVKVSHTFKEAGTFNVELKVTDNNGESNTAQHIVNVKSDIIIESEIKNIPEDAVLTPSRAYQFDASESKSLEGEVVKFEWNFGDGKTGVGRKVTHAYEKEGVYEVTLTLTDDAGNRRVITKNYTVSQSPSGLFAKIVTLPELKNNEVSGTLPLRVNFDGGASSGANIVEYNWDFNNDGVTDASGQTAEHVYTSSGVFNPTLTITSADQKTAKVAVKVVVQGSAFEARVNANPSSGVVPLTVNFDATSTKVPEGENIVAFRWDFGDGSPLLTEGPIVSHKYTSIGTFKVRVTAITATNKTAESEITIIVTATPLKACFAMSREVGPAPLTVNFNPQCSTGTISAYNWKFGNNNQTSERRPTFTFTEKGLFPIELEIVDSDNNVSIFKDEVLVE